MLIISKKYDLVLKWKHLLLGALFIFIDLMIYIFIGLILMNYEDFYDESEGEYWTWASMTSLEKAAYLGLHIWYLINLVVIGYLIYQLIKRIKKHTGQQ